MTTRPRSAPATRAAILAAARTRFGESGYDRTTLRAVAGDVGVDAALVARYFGSKEQLFAEASSLDLHLPDLTGLAPADIPGRVLPVFFRVWEEEGTFLPLLRAAASNPAVAETLVGIFRTQVLPTVAAVAPDHLPERAGLIGSQILGLALGRYVLRVPPLVEMSHADIAAWVGPVLTGYLTGPAPTSVPVPPEPASAR